MTQPGAMKERSTRCREHPLNKESQQRTCIGCRQVRPKAELVRLTRGKEREVKVDHQQVAPGRGAYSCPTPECLERALAQNRLARALKSPLAPIGLNMAEILESWRRR